MSMDILINLSQIIVLMVATLVVMLTTAFARDHGLINGLTLTSLAIALIVFVFLKPVLPLEVTPLLILDGYTLFFSSLILISAFVVCLLAYPYFEQHNPQNEEFYSLLLMATLGAIVLAGSYHFLTFFLGMEILSVSLYGMIAYTVHNRAAAKFPLEASVKYLVMSGASSGFMLFGIALLYAQTGSLAFSELPALIADSGLENDPVMILGLMLLLAGIAFKLSLVPFHMWTPDVYEGAPVPVTAFIATVSKAAMLAIVLRVLLLTEVYMFRQLVVTLTVLAAASMLVGNLLALMQHNLKRLLAYSSIAHLGYLLVILVAGAAIDSPFAVEAMGYYIAAYVLTTLAGFGVVSALSSGSAETDEVVEYIGLFWLRPWLASVMIIVMLSLAGIPLTMGFIGKFYIINAGVDGSLWFLLSMLVVGSGIGLYYYLRLVYLMLQNPVGEHREDSPVPIPFGVNAALAGLAAVVLVLGVYPAPLMETLFTIGGDF